MRRFFAYVYIGGEKGGARKNHLGLHFSVATATRGESDACHTGRCAAVAGLRGQPLKSQGRERKKQKNYSTEYSHVVPHHSTDSAIKCLTAQIGRDAVVLLVYGRNSKV